MSTDITPRRFGVTQNGTNYPTEPCASPESTMSEGHGLMKKTGGEHGGK